ncbi:MAG: hypothetical protein AAF962_27455 [Actinomycetota bacterium]
MVFADVLRLDLVAEIFGVSTDTLMQRLDRGGLPEAVHNDGDWSVPTQALPMIAEREGWTLPVEEATSNLPAATPELPASTTEVDTIGSETMAAHAAVVLAKTQASAARAEASDLTRQVRKMRAELESARQEIATLKAQMTAAQREQAILERDRAVAEARAEELRGQVDQERVERSMLAARIGVLEADREDAITSMDRWSRRRYERRQARSAGAPTPKWIQSLAENHPSGTKPRGSA